WEAVRGVVLDGAIYCTRAVIESMVKNKYGRIVFFTGEGAFMGGSGRAAVSAAKMGLVGLARGLASEFAAQNIRVNVVSPGSIDTSRANPEWYQGRTPTAAGIPLGRQGTVDEIAATCLFLVTDDGGFITGQTIHANGGVADVARRQTEAGVDVVTDGEQSKTTFFAYIVERFNGFTRKPAPAGQEGNPRGVSREYRAFPDYYAWSERIAEWAGGRGGDRNRYGVDVCTA